MSSRRSSRRSFERSACPAGRTSTAVTRAVGCRDRLTAAILEIAAVTSLQGGRWSSGSWVPSRRSPTATRSAAPAGRCGCSRSCSSTGPRCAGRRRDRGALARRAARPPGERPADRRLAASPHARRGRGAVPRGRLPAGGRRARRGAVRRLARAGHDALARGEPAPRDVRLGKALALWRGTALEDVRFEPFAVAVAERLEEERLEAIARASTPSSPSGATASCPGAARARGGAPAARVAARPADARALPLRAPVRRARRLQRASRGAPRAARARPLARAARARALDPAPRGRRARTAAGSAGRRLRHGRRPRDQRRRTARPRAPARGDRPRHTTAEEVARRHGHPPLELLGDEVAAVFGAPVAHEDDAARATHVALSCSMRSPVSPESWHRTTSISRSAPAWRRGPALTRPGSPPVGDVVATAGRLARAAAAGEVGVDERTRALLDAGRGAEAPLIGRDGRARAADRGLRRRRRNPRAPAPRRPRRGRHRQVAARAGARTGARPARDRPDRALSRLRRGDHALARARDGRSRRDRSTP